MSNVTDLSFRIPRDQRPTITCGRMADGRPKSLDHWNVDSYPEIAAAYGDTPKELLFYLPGTPEEMSQSEYSAWGSNNKRKRFCDGESCVHRIPETHAGVKCAAGEITGCICKEQYLPRGHRDRCTFHAMLSVLVVDPTTHRLLGPSVYRIGTGSKSSYEAFWSLTQYITRIYGEDALEGTLYALSIKMVSKKDDDSRRMPVWRARAVKIGGTPALANAPSGKPLDTPPPATALPPAPAPPPVTTPVAAATAEPTAPVPDTVESAGLTVLPSPPVPEAELLRYDRAGRELYGEQWARKRTEYLSNRTLCGQATYAMEATIAKRDAGISDEAWKRCLRAAAVIDIMRMTQASLGRLTQAINAERKTKQHRDRMDGYNAERRQRQQAMEESLRQKQAV